tara:strand:- start:6680 stop:7348 length:669 start_codon:yes stop_codon:yes gene_type:complete
MSIVFPIVFSIGGAYKRREAALREYAAIKGYLRSIYFVSRDWNPKSKKINAKKAIFLIEDLFNNIRLMFTNSNVEINKYESKLYGNFSDLSKFINIDLKESGLSLGECSRINQYLQKLLISFESIKHIYQYRTPRTLKAFSSLFIFIIPIIYGPYFAFQAENMSYGLEYVTPILLTMILVSLKNIQEHLENPFDQVGLDDVKFNVKKFIENLKISEGVLDKE